MADPKDLVTYIAQSLVDDPDAVEISELDRKRDKVVRLSVAQGDMGRVIGRDGRIANAIRTLLRYARYDTTWGLEVRDEDEDAAG